MRRLALLLALIACPVLLVAQAVSSPVVAKGPLLEGFSGAWVGVLEYRDYSNDAMTQLPTWVEMTHTENAVTLAYVYDDGPGKVVRERVVLTLAGAQATLTGKAGDPVETFAVAGMEEFAKLHRGVLTLTGAGVESGKPVDVRVVLTLRRNLYTWRKETRAAGSGGEFKFRDGYTFTRAVVPG